MAADNVVGALRNTQEIELTVIGRKSRRRISRPVWLVEEGDKIYLVPVQGSDTEWYKNILINPTVRIAADGISWSAKATPITDPQKVREVVDKFRAKYGADQIEKYYSKLDVAVEVPLS